MLDKQTDKNTKTDDVVKPRRSKPGGGKDPSEANPLWQSLALRSSAIQPKLAVSQPGDPYEREADRVADQVMRAPEPLDQAASVVPANVSEAAHSDGQSLDPSTRDFMESRFGHDFSRVKVHTDARADEAATAVNARAFTLKRDIVFGSGEYEPATPEGKRLLAHELGHVVQQSRGDASSSSMGLGIQREATAGGGTPPPIEHIAGGLWATDAEGKPLPPSLADISQGGVNDCFLFAAMAAIAHTNPQKIVDMIEDHGDDTYTVTFEGIGVFSSATQTVSADFVVGRHGNVGSRKAIWPLIVEKAYAQQKGGLDELDKGGNAGDAVDDMLNEGASRFDPRDETADYLMGKLTQAKTKGWPMILHAPKKDGAGKEKKEMADKTPGLYFWHAYPVIDVDGDKNRIKLFNPWGKDHPNGDGWIDVEKARSFFIEVDIND